MSKMQIFIFPLKQLPPINYLPPLNTQNASIDIQSENN